jgi:hypothetical protein
MQRLVHVIESEKGYLSDLERYTEDIVEAVTFVSFEVAVERLTTVRKRLTETCWVDVAYLPFPRPKPVEL